MLSPFGALNLTRQAAEATGRRVASLIKLIDRADAALDDLVELRRSIQFIADNIAELTESAAGINRNAGEIAAEIVTLSRRPKASILTPRGWLPTLPPSPAPCRP